MIYKVRIAILTQYFFLFLKTGAAYYPGTVGPQSTSMQQPEVVQLYIPEKSVGAVIGSKGQNIKNIMRLSGARIKVVFCLHFVIFNFVYFVRF